MSNKVTILAKMTLGLVGCDRPFEMKMEREELADMDGDERRNFIWESLRDYAFQHFADITFEEPSLEPVEAANE